MSFANIIALLGYIVLVDLLVLLVFVAIGFLLAQTMPATYAILRRNFTGYFNNPTGYVFLIVFVLLTSAAAFCTDEFFNANLANLDQLNYWIPAILLVFVPSITMSIWAQEQQQGTDELLLTLPATDFDVVLGKYLAAVGIYSVSLLFSHAANFAVLAILSEGEVDLGLFSATYLGYWFMGLAMLSLGMVCSFLTSNLTVAFILGGLINAPFALAALIGTTIPSLLFFAGKDAGGMSQTFTRWGYYEQFSTFGRGVISLASVTYFMMIAVAGVYLSLAFLGQRHWATPRKAQGDDMKIWMGYGLTALRYLIVLVLLVVTTLGWDFTTAFVASLWLMLALGIAYLFLVDTKDAPPMLEHHIIRVLTLVLIMVGIGSILSTRDVRLDLTQGSISSLSPETVKLLQEMDPKRPIVIEAYIGREIPEPYAKAKYDLVTMLGEMKAVGGGKVDVRIYDNLELSGDSAERAEKQFDIKPENIRWMQRGVFRQDDVLLGAAFRSGLQRNVIKFFNNGVPVEYELARTLAAVAQEKKKKLGVLRTDAELNGGFDMQRMSSRPREAILDELEQQYIVEEADPNSSLLDKDYDVLLAVQPSSLTPPQIDNLLQAIQGGLPTAIFEDPLPNFFPAPGTDQPKRPRGGGMFGGQQPPEPKGDIRLLFKQLGVEFVGGKKEGKDVADIVWQYGIPYPKVGTRNFTNEWVFVTADKKPMGDNKLDTFNAKQPIVAGMHEVLLPYPGGLQEQFAKGVTFTPLLVTGEQAGKISYDKFQATMREGGPTALEFAEGKPSGNQIILAAAIEKEASADSSAKKEEKKDEKKTDDKDEKGEAKEKKNYGGMKVIVVADIDVLASVFVGLRARPDPEAPITWRFQNVPFVLNTIDWLASDERFLAIRNRESRFSTLRMVDKATEGAWDRYNGQLNKYQEKFKIAQEAKESEMKKSIEELQTQATALQQNENANQAELEQLVLRLELRRQQLSRELKNDIAALERERKRDTEKSDRQRDAEIVAVKSGFRFWSLVLPPIPAILIGIGVYIVGLVRENMTAPSVRMK